MTDQPRPFIPSADQAARMVIAACDALHTHPVRAFEVRRGSGRTALLGAAVALVQGCGLTNLRAAAMLGVSAPAVATAKHHGGDGFVAARRAASDVLIRLRLDLPPATATAPTTSPAVQAAPESPEVRDRRAEIQAAMARQGIPLLPRPPKVTVVGVEKDKALLPPARPGECAWPLGDVLAGTHRACGARTVDGRRYCAPHLKTAGLPTTPRQIETMDRLARPATLRDMGGRG